MKRKSKSKKRISFSEETSIEEKLKKLEKRYKSDIYSSEDLKKRTEREITKDFGGLKKPTPPPLEIFRRPILKKAAYSPPKHIEVKPSDFKLKVIKPVKKVLIPEIKPKQKEKELKEFQDVPVAARPPKSEIEICADNLKKIKKEMSKVLIGQEVIVDGLLRGLLCDGHVLLEGVPGIAKTLAIRALGASSGCEVKRVQFTVDLLPTDIVGITSYTPQKGFEVVKGPVFANFLIADEINRATPKCVLGDTPIILDNGDIFDIKNIVKTYNGKKTYKENNEYWIVPKKKLNLLAFDTSDYTFKPEEVKYLYKQKTSEPYYNVELKSGRKIKTSKIHPFFTLENGEVKTIQTDKLKKGDCVLIPRKLQISGDNKLIYDKESLKRSLEVSREIIRRKRLYKKVQSFKNKKCSEIINKLAIDNRPDENLVKSFLISKPIYFDCSKDCFFSEIRKYVQIRGIKKPETMNKEFARFMAILIAEGNVNGNFFYLTMKDPEIPRLFIQSVKKLFDIDVNLLYDQKRNQYRVAFGSYTLVDLLKALGYNPHLKAKNKKIPGFVLKAEENTIKEFLKFYFECDGCISRGRVKVTTKSKSLANSLSYLLLRLGFVSRIHKKVYKTQIGGYSYKRGFYNLCLYGGDLYDFHKKIGFYTSVNKKKLEENLNNFAKKNTDLIPGLHKLIRDFRKSSRISHKKFYNLTGMHAHNLENPKNAFAHSRNRLKRLSIFDSNPNYTQIAKLISGNFYCDYVNESKKITPKKSYWLYDFSMKNNHSFVAGFGGIISHNTQSALLESMQERQATIGKVTYPLPKPFFVMATENPLESAGVYPLPEAQIDRFLFKILMDYPEKEDEMKIMASNMTIMKFEDFGLKAVVSPNDLITMQGVVKKIYLDDRIKKYILDIVTKTRKRDFEGSEYVTYGASPRASIALFIASKARALMEGRNFVIPEDVRSVVFDVLRHRLIMSYKAVLKKISPDDIIQTILNEVKVE